MNIEELYTTETHEEGSDLTIKDHAGKDTKLIITVRGYDSPTYQKALKKQKMLYTKALRKNENIDESPFIIEALVSAIIGWKGVERSCTPAAISELLTKAPAVREQIDVFNSDRANFTKPKSKK